LIWQVFAHAVDVQSCHKLFVIGCLMSVSEAACWKYRKNIYISSVYWPSYKSAYSDFILTLYIWVGLD